MEDSLIFFWKYVNALLRLKGIIQEKDINIAICLDDKKNYTSVDITNQLLILESSIIEKESSIGKREYEVKDLQLIIDDYRFTSKFNIKYMFYK